jgi:guanosine-3',5'-bis(diphosphate) 3'-pyrophosphohydrolase
MMRQFELVESVLDYRPDADEALLNKAYVYAMQKHGEQKRANGDPYFSHPLEVAAILMRMQLDEATIATALLHDTIEDTDATRNEIDALFGQDIGALVEGLTKIQAIDFESRQVAQAENLRKLLLAVSDDVRVLLVKLADRLHNMRTLHFVPPEKRARIAQETMDIYAPLAGRMGIQDMRDELEDLSFRYLHPEAHEALTARLDELNTLNKDLVERVRDALALELKLRGINARIKGRQKRAYSIFRKMQRKSLSFEQLSDIFGFRIIVESLEDCYRALGAVHTRWKTVPGRFKDYISTPKQNDYRSIHTTIVGPVDNRVELQIRTEEMHTIAEYGVAAHAFYKDSEKLVPGGSSNAYGWLRHTIELLDGDDTSEDFLENTKLELFLDQVFCFTPKGMLIALPSGATPIDFAYAVHTKIGDSCVGAKINGQGVPANHRLQNGDEVEILRAKSRSPSPMWEASAVTGKARAAIRRLHRQQRRETHIGIGLGLLRYELTRGGNAYDPSMLKPAVKEFSAKDADHLLQMVGSGQIARTDVLKTLGVESPNSGDAVLDDENPEMSARLRGVIKAESFSHLQTQLPIRFSPEGGALPGDRIIGVLEPDKGITIYPIDSPSLAQFEDDGQWFDMSWDIPEDSTELFPASMELDVSNVPGALATIAETVAANGGNIIDLSMTSGEEKLVHMQINLQIATLKDLNMAMNALRANKVVSQVRRRLG